MTGQPTRQPRTRRKAPVPVGLLYSLTGTYGIMGLEMFNGAMLAIEQINANPDLDFELRPVVMDPGGSLPQYSEQCDVLVNRHGVRHIIGCYTSASRKQILPLVEGSGALLWHSARYEGFESSENVIYLGAAPNQHVVPLAFYVLKNLDPRIYCLGSNYIWTWEINRVMRDILAAGGGTVVAERLPPLGEKALDHLVDDIASHAPGAVLNTLVGESAYSFYSAWHAAVAERPELARITMLSLSLCEAELKLTGQHEGGHIVSSVYFQSIDRPQNARFLSDYRTRYRGYGSPSVDTEAAYLCATMLGRAITQAGTADVASVRHALYRDRFEAPQGPVSVDPENNHSFLTPRLGRSTAAGTFDIFWQSAKPVKPDPYLAWLDLEDIAPTPGSKTSKDPLKLLF
ncbi:transporter substrate-binding domain-containing protein [Microbaculum marinum]|uniref:Transporter substrate-binding domain-containing protein n=1 Tax=Microbaculum marinum TaxID=1764581 RepID=A0AAW9RF24_9HYPH